MRSSLPADGGAVASSFAGATYPTGTVGAIAGDDPGDGTGVEFREDDHRDERNVPIPVPQVLSAAFVSVAACAAVTLSGWAGVADDCAFSGGDAARCAAPTGASSASEREISTGVLEPETDASSSVVAV